MKKPDLGQTIGILANLGVIAGIVFLAIEVRQNQEWSCLVFVDGFVKPLMIVPRILRG